jgi:hypothetical protein
MWKPAITVFLVFLCLNLAAVSSAASQNVKTPACLTPRSKQFRVFDSLGHEQKPDLSRQGMQPIHVIDRGFWLDDSTMVAADPVKVSKLIDDLPKDGGPIVLDIEHLSLREDPIVARRNAELLAKIARIFKAAAPNRPIGFYGMLPIGDYDIVTAPKNGQTVARWRRKNDVINVLEREVDMLFPSLYTFYGSRSIWQSHARAVICEARRLSKKPVYPFIWPEYHEGSPLQHAPVPADFWALQLDLLAANADGLVMWGGWDFPRWKMKQWDESEPWWTISKQKLSKWRKEGRQ